MKIIKLLSSEDAVTEVVDFVTILGKVLKNDYDYKLKYVKEQ